MRKAMLRLLLATFILGIIDPAVGTAMVSNANLNDYCQSCINKQSQILPLVKNVQVKINIAGHDYCFSKPLWTGSIPGCLVTGFFNASPKHSQNIHSQQHLQRLLYPPHFFG